MLELRKKLKKNRKGFTLIELIVVIAILAILALLAIPRFATTLENSKVKTDEANLRVIASAAQLHYAEVGSYPADVDALVTGKYLDVAPTIQSDTYNGLGFVIDGATGVVTIE
ncbi:prepilin-type N-terminal cleavage/methylation domain-containing protein [Alkalibacter mobilis]|uniref:prepilin-type N-terminal cleavage/methylation domain-containing protein n=1 Tax=Alkalibacter mobilis TaxID=2787712 RepID=UPI00189F63FC|nr:prepilin-type N-terminal cleavage/methylation domain-containing protein [Alkalibacter mobilis]MBF7095761.1 prepilin-type N-terminal cleavage/methylation domain-containing protein [Alkalibacter mobilis]